MRTMVARRRPIAVAAVDAAWADPCRKLQASSGFRLRRQETEVLVFSRWVRKEKEVLAFPH